MSLFTFFHQEAKPLDKFDRRVPPSWQTVLKTEFFKDYYVQLKAFLEEEYKEHTVYPPKKLIFKALELTPFKDVRVVILGQDPYHGDGQAEGLSFSVPKGLPVPSSLQNIYRELVNDIKGFLPPKHGHLEHWAEQGVLLLNTGLTVRAHQANSHKDKGWEPFTDAIIKRLNAKKKGLVFLLWGRHAQNKKRMIDEKKHRVLCAAHPSGLSAHRGFFGCKHFSKTNAYLKQHGKMPIQWDL